MTVYLMLYLCTSAALDDCQAFVADRWEGPQARAECRASVAPTLEHLRAEGVKHAVAHCESEE